MAISDLMCPAYKAETTAMKKFRLTLAGGTTYIATYLYRYSDSETEDSYSYRVKMACAPQQAATALQKIVDSISTRMIDVVRRSSSPSYQSIIGGQGRGVDRRGASMNTFIMRQVLRELLAMKRVAIHIDRESLDPKTTLADANKLTPYCVLYKAEDIRSWAYGEDGKLSAILLRATVDVIDKTTLLPTGSEVLYRQFTVVKDKVNFKEIAIEQGQDVIRRQFDMDFPSIPIVLMELNASLLENIADMQIVLMNYDSSDSVLMKYNFPILTKQKEMNGLSNLPNLPASRPPRVASATTGATDSATAPVTSADVYGTSAPEPLSPETIQHFGKGMERPDFVAPPTGPLEVSMRKQEEITKRIYECLSLYYRSARGVYQSDGSRNEDQRNGLNGIALELARCETEIAKVYCIYDNVDQLNDSVEYPRNFDTRTDEERTAEAKELCILCDALPSITAKREMMKKIVRNLLVNAVSTNQLAQIMTEIDAAKTIVGSFQTLKLLLDSLSILPAEAKLLFTGGN